MNYVYAQSPYAEEPPPRPVPPPRMPAGPPRVPVVAQYLVLGSSAGTTALLLAAGVLVTMREDELVAWWYGAAPGNETVTLAYLLGALTGLTNLVALVATGIWLLEMRRVAEWTAPGGHRRSAYWAVLGWIVPVVNLWFPYQVVADVSRRVGSVVPTFWPWWIAWLALNSYTVLDVSGGELTTVGDLTWWIRSQQVGAVVALLACLMWWHVVRSATTAAEAAVRGDTVDP